MPRRGDRINSLSSRYLFREIKRPDGDSAMLIESLTILLKYFHRLLRVTFTKLDVLSMRGNSVVRAAIMRLNYLRPSKARYAALVPSIRVHVIALTDKSA